MREINQDLDVSKYQKLKMHFAPETAVIPKGAKYRTKDQRYTYSESSSDNNHSSNDESEPHLLLKKAIMEADLEGMKTLLNQYQDANPSIVNMRDKRGDPIIKWAIIKQNIDAVRLMIKYKADLNLKTRSSDKSVVELTDHWCNNLEIKNLITTHLSLQGEDDFSDEDSIDYDG